MKRTWKRIGSLLLAVCMVMTMLPTVTFAAEGDTFTYENLEYKVLTEDAGAKTGTVALVGGTKWNDLSVAEAVYNSDITYTVTQVGDGSVRIFPLALNMGDITISDTVTTIADYAFRGAAMDSITLGNSLETIGKYAFQNSLVLTSIEIPDSVTTIDEGAFSYPRDLQQVTFGASSKLETIGKEAFKSCNKLTEISIPDSVTTLGISAFSFCEELTTLTIGNGIEEIGESAFTYCIKLADLTIPSSVKGIGTSAFSGCQSLTEINIPNSVTSIGGKAFNNCTELLTIDISDSVEEIGNEAFANSIKLDNVIIPESVDTMGMKLFQGCAGLRTVTVGNIIGELMFDGCSSLESVTITGTPDSIGGYAFSGCTNLSSINIPDSVRAIGSSAFYKCSNLSNISWGNSVENIGAGAFCKTGFTAVTIPNTVTEIDRIAFQNCNELINVTIGSGVRTMNNQVFYNCAKLKSATFLGNVPTTIYSNAFQGCTSLTSIYVPDDKVDVYKAKLTSYTGIIKLMSAADTEITGFNALADVDAGTAGNATYANATAVITALPANVVANYSGGTVEWPVTTWVDTDGYNSVVAGSYTFTATLDGAPAGYANSGGHTATVEVVVSAVLPDAPITTAEGLKAALEVTTSSTINVMADIELTSFITLGASHTLNIADGVTISTRGAKSYDCLLKIPQDMTMTLTGSGTLKSDNLGTTGIAVWGTLQLEPGSKLLAANGGASGISLGVLGSSGRLVSNGGHITLQNSGENSTGISTNIYESEVNLSGGTLTVSNSGNGSRGIIGAELTATKGCAITVNSNNGDMSTTGIFVTSPIALQNCTLTIANTAGEGLRGSLSADTSTVTVKNSGSDSSGITIGMGLSLDLTNNSTLNLENAAGKGLFLMAHSNITINNSTVNVKNGGGMGFSGNEPYVTVIGLNSGCFILRENARLNGVEGLLCDQGFVCNTSNDITVGAVDASPSADGLTAGEYVWKDTIFTKGDATKTYPIIVTNGSADLATAKPGDIVTLTEDPAPTGQQFKEWICTSGNATIVYDYDIGSWKFTMPSEAVTVKAVYETAPYLYVLGVPVHDANKDSITGQGISGGVSYDPTTKTLTLNNAVITSSTPINDAIYAEDDLTVKLVGQNRIGTAPSSPANKADYSVGIGIISRKSISLTGEGSLTVYDAITGINGVENLTVDIGGSLIVMEYGDEGMACCLKTNGVLTIKRGSLNLASYNSKGLQGGSIVINGGVITAQTQGASGHFALSTEPSFGGAYAYRVFAGDNAASAVEVPSPVAATFTASKYVRIQPEDAQIYTISFNTNGGNATNPGTLTTGADGKLSVLPIPTRSGRYRFDGWFTAASGGTVVTTSTEFTTNTTIYAHWTYTGGGNSGGSSSGGTTTGKIPDQPVTTTAPVIATTGTNGAANASISDKAITDAIAKAQADAKAQGKTAKGTIVALGVTMPQGATSLTATLTRDSLSSLVSAGVSQFELNGGPISLSLDLRALQEIQKQSSGNISITITPAAGLSNEAKALLGNRPVYSITISYVKDGKTIYVTGLRSGTATLSIPYTPGNNEAVAYLFGVYVDAKGKAQRVPGSTYDANSKSLLIPTGHFSVYGVGYTAPSAKFTDIGTHWGKEAIDYIVGRGLLSGTTETTFAPNTAMTRGMLVTALGRLAGVDAKAYATNSFTDVKADSTFHPYIEWAYKKGVVQGIGNQQFAPDRAITREEIAVIFANYAKATGDKLPEIRTATTYEDADRIGSTYNTAVTAMQQAGIMMGGADNRFNPKSNATRGEVSSMLHRYIKLTIDPATAH